MLRQLVRLMEEEEVTRVDDLARRLGLRPALVRAMLETLAQQGRLRPVGPTCGLDGACATCPLNGMCGVARPSAPVLWAVQKPSPREGSPKGR